MNDNVIDIPSNDHQGHPTVACPNPQANMQLWNTHPKVFLSFGENGEARCPYCGTRYRLTQPAATLPQN